MAPETQRFFLSVSNPRTGSSYLVTALNELPGVRADYEMKWRPRYPIKTAHLIMSSEGWLCRPALSRIGDSAEIAGSKLVLDCLPYDRNEIWDISHRIDRDIPLIHLTRNYFDVILSLKARGAFNLLNRPPAAGTGSTVIAGALQEFGDDPRIRQLETGRPVAQSAAALEKALQFLVGNDLFCLALCQRASRSMRIDYEQLYKKLPDIARFIGYVGDPSAIDAVRKNPITRKLPPLAAELIPNAVKFRQLCDIVYAKIVFACEMNLPFEDIWKDDGTIQLPGVGA